ncbi:MAG TPA: FAD-dependent oxidoreductase [Candidatus Binatia bacterium]|nr:FAD-dependent oxidoreductase [Candidatus Binatia bacterium]
MKDPGRIVILGAGPTGLGAAHRLHELGFDRWTLLERDARPGGLARSYVDDCGFTWDVGGHVQFSHYAYYDALCDRALGDAWLHHERESWVWIKGRFVPYPFQYNIHRLDPDDCEAALRGLERAAAAPPRTVTDFGDWILATFGQELADLFFYPYNFKVWGHPPPALDVEWMGERVAVPDMPRLRRNVRERRDDVSWGPNNTFRFPLHGGTGAIWAAVAAWLPAERYVSGADVARVALAERAVVLADGRRIPYDALVSTMPLDRLVAMSEGLDAGAHAAARTMLHSAVHVVGVGLRGPRPETLARKCWMYFPEAHNPYFRVTVFSNYSPNHAPPGCWSLMAEVSETAHRPVDAATLGAATVAAMRRDGLIGPEAEVVSVWHHREEHGYPTPFLGRDAVLATLLPALERHGVYSRGRFGAWKYEVSNQDHSSMQGVEVAERLLGVGAGDEPTLNRPDWVNGGALAAPPRPVAGRAP